MAELWFSTALAIWGLAGHGLASWMSTFQCLLGLGLWRCSPLTISRVTVCDLLSEMGLALASLWVHAWRGFLGLSGQALLCVPSGGGAALKCF